MSTDSTPGPAAPQHDDEPRPHPAAGAPSVPAASPAPTPGAVPYVRNETTGQQLDRNYTELLQELRVAQNGVQILFAFLLTLVFQARFAAVTDLQRGVYLATLLSSAAAVVCFIAPVSAHRLMFRKQVKDELVRFTGRCAIAGLCLLAVSILGALLLIVGIAAGRLAAGLAVGGATVLMLVLWWVLPSRVRARTSPPS
ncbi:sodium:proton antiporter [Nakamurella flavida]|uniref:Sodium:proton antiporter n=1 Tax=Nakamurella flavida TaxID=363630 RepID=A0A938YNK5_9ACTN|nr:DUF6328 family protein [Nakamurella flavida]MBM9476348.1 sodium:proton antiporter [Nakamurella flavida]MDP9779552.1 hypothetical protein [Nakamurella flavida]